MRCPNCGAEMVKRTARRGPYSGKEFYGCSRYPKCQTIIELTDSAAAGGGTEPDVPVADLVGHPRESVEWVDVRSAGPRYYLFRAVGARLECASIPEDDAEKARQILRHATFIEERFGRVSGPLPFGVQQVLAVFTKLLTRGSLPFVTPWLEEAILSTHPDGQAFRPNDEDPDRLLFRGRDGERIKLSPCDLLAPLLQPWVGSALDLRYDSQEEAIFHQELMPTLLSAEVLRFVHVQAPLGALTGAEADGERVDFLLSAPWSPPIVVEIDGEQHANQMTRDEGRDARLREAGLAVLRIPAREVRAGEGPGLDQFRLAAKQIRDNRTPVSATNSIEARLAWAPVQAARLQLAVVHAVKRGVLAPGAVEWVLGVQEDEYGVARLALHDLAIQMEALEDLYAVRVLPGVIRVLEIAPPTVSFHLSSPRPLRVAFDVEGEGACNRKPDLVLTCSATRGPYEAAESLPPGWESSPRLSVHPIVLPVWLRYESEGGTRAKLHKSEAADAALEAMLRAVFRMRAFWEGQREALWRVLEGGDALVLLPTGAGKSLVYQLGSLLLPGRAVIVDPILALIDDQLFNLQEMGIDRAAGITSRETREGIGTERLRALALGEHLFCFVAPERFQTRAFRDALQALRQHTVLNLVVIDEAHCVSEWGHDFRTAYLNIARIARIYGEDDSGMPPPLLGLTGTASRAVLKDVRRELRILELDAIVTPQSFDRRELELHVRRAPTPEKGAALVGWLRNLPILLGEPASQFFRPRGGDTACGIVFCPHVRGEMGVDQQAQCIRESLGVQVGIYSGGSPAGLAEDEWGMRKQETARLFKKNSLPLLVATKAFGMGIDKPNIRYTVHFGIPGSLEAFYQEAGRAGRDRRRAVCTVLFSNDYPDRAEQLLDPKRSLEEVAKLYDKIDWGTQDDVSRMLFFHRNAFSGVAEEINWIRLAVRLIGKLDGPTVQEIPFQPPELDKLFPEKKRSTDPRNNEEYGRRGLEKALHRLVLLAVVRDYEVDYGAHTFTVRTEGVMPERTKRSVEEYVREYNLARSLEIRERLDAVPTGSPAEFLEGAARILISFIYDVIERGRRRALREIWLWARDGRKDLDLRRRLLDYLVSARKVLVGV